MKLNKRKISFAELNAHATDGDCWISLHRKVYDISQFHSKHPGGELIMQHAGMEAGDQFEMFHNPTVRLHLRQYFIGTLVTEDDEKNEDSNTFPNPCDVFVEDHQLDVAAHWAGKNLQCTKEYQELRRELWKEGGFEISTQYFSTKMVIAMTLWLTGLISIAHYTNHNDNAIAPLMKWFIGPLLLAFGMMQWAFIAHDTQHNGVIKPRGITWQRNLLAQISGGFFMGLSASMWLKEHNDHHLFTNRPAEDPHFDYKFLWLQNFKELPHWRKVLPQNPTLRAMLVAIAKILISIQHLTVVPLAVVVGRYAFLCNCWIYAICNRKWDDIMSMSIHMCWYYSFVFTFYHTFWERVCFVFINYLFNGILHLQLLLSHFCFNQFTKVEELSLGVFQFQLLTTRNVKSYWWTHWFHGGLELQIEHHLFPQLPRHKLRDVKPRVESIAKKYNIPYVEVGFFEGIYDCMVEGPWKIAQTFAKAEFFH